ncbi:hydrogenase nickel incorporation protein HypB [Leptothoe spongobia]|uniref:Hydrogenase nickel incorporation protein HypB n=1 Tax=Leptothoe spongobia TAU-MAC 1115 TaxID=1967444 RepID=A0A947DFG6_9CYAN|nr:hydrogenase nickel incorporation protein HypB [Leptothoe spongobia]MBT9315916.1 hydrogenase nickel incorporation protein HypB [Leptothoe spongobia TAU-MAC 1115]
MCGHCGCKNTRQTLSLHQNVLDKNDHYAEHNRVLFQHLLVLNVLSSPGTGKTTLIQRILRDCDLIAGADPLNRYQGVVRPGVIVGDLATNRDAERLRQTEQPVIQINTGNLCHLEAESVGKAAQQLTLDSLNLLIIENVGNLVCPAVYDLGEDLRIVLMSVTEGEDKPLKYPTMFKSAHAVVITKTDIADVVGFNRKETLEYLRLIAPQALIFELSATTGEGLTNFYAYLNQALSQRIAPAFV